MTDAIRTLLLLAALSALAFGAWAVLSHEAAAWLLAPSLAITVASIAAWMDGEP